MFIGIILVHLAQEEQLERMGQKLTGMIILFYVFIERRAEGTKFNNDSIIDFDLKQFKGIKRQTRSSSKKFKQYE